jgi:hypothetical protein
MEVFTAEIKKNKPKDIVSAIVPLHVDSYLAYSLNS